MRRSLIAVQWTFIHSASSDLRIDEAAAQRASACFTFFVAQLETSSFKTLLGLNMFSSTSTIFSSLGRWPLPMFSFQVTSPLVKVSFCKVMTDSPYLLRCAFSVS
jgi:hypothetical protein